MEIILGLVAGILTMSGIIPQIVKAHRTQKTGDVSAGMLIVIMLGVLLWCIYGILRDDWAILITNALAFIFNSYMLVLVYKFRE